MPNNRFVVYHRVSTTKQGVAGLGIDAQRAAVADYLGGRQCYTLGEFVEVESGANNDRPQLALAMQQCRLTGSTLLISRLDRLSRDASFLLGLDKEDISFVCANMPDATKFTIGIFANLAEHERTLISERTSAALKIASARRKVAGLAPLGGVRPGHRPVDGRLGVAAVQAKAKAFADRVRPIAQDLRATGISLQAIANELTIRHVRTPRGGKWTANAVMKILAPVSPTHTT